MKPIEENKNSLPDNAFRELKEDEEYVPLMKPEEKHRELTAWSVTWGIIMAIVFSAATAYLGLKVGQVLRQPYLSPSLLWDYRAQHIVKIPWVRMSSYKALGLVLA